MSTSETIIYWIGIYTITVSIVWLIGSLFVLTFEYISLLAGDIYGIRRLICAIRIVKRWEQRRERRNAK